MKEFRVNDYITLKLESDETIIYVKKQQFIQCKFLLLNIPVDQITSLDEINSIDEAAEELDNSLEHDDHAIELEIPPGVQFWAHSSNLQVWAENNYDTRLLHSNLAFPLLKKLSEVGDPLAKQVFKTEIIQRYKSGHKATMKFLEIEGFLKFLSFDEVMDLILIQKDFIFLMDLLDQLNALGYNLTMEELLYRVGIDNKRVVEIDLHEHQLEYFPKAILKFDALQVLILYSNKIKELPSKIFKLKLLRKLFLGSNKLRFLPNSICQLEYLEEFWIGGNKLSCLPKELGQLTNLKSLKLSNNRLRCLPKELGQLTNLELLILSHNRLRCLPDSICLLKSLKDLSLNSNKLMSLPEGLSNLNFLEALFLGDNLFKKVSKRIVSLSLKRKDF